MKVNRQALIQALETVAPVLGAAGSPADMQAIKFWDDKVQVSNGLVWIQNKLPVDLGYRVSVPGAPFIALLKSLKADEVELKLGKDAKYLAVQTNRVEGKFNGTKLEKFVEIDFSMWKIIHDDKTCKAIASGLISCRNNVSKDENAGALQGVRIDGNRIISTNRSRIFRFSLPTDTQWQCTVYTTFIDIVASHRDRIEAFLLFDGAFGVMAGDVKIQTKLIDGKYPELDQYFPDQTALSGAKTISFDESINDVLGRQIEFVKGMDSADKESTIVVAGKTMFITTRNPSIGEITETIPLAAEVDRELTFLINPILLRDVAAGSKWFSFLPESKLVMFECEEVKHLLQTRE